jgi:LysR family glycine cleavage system transcriptional activator
MKRRLPSFPSLRAFESAARLLSFKAAAEELCVTQSAISHQVRILESFLEGPLFIRHPQSVELTLRGTEYLEMVSYLLDNLDAATQKIRVTNSNGPLYVQASPAFAGFWLLPRMLRFNRCYPGIEVNLSTISASESAASHSFDVRINCSWEVPPEAGSERFMETPHVPVCNPDLLKQGSPITRIEDLFQYPILRAQGDWDLWDRWLTHLGCKALPRSSASRFENTYLALQAAEEGLGIALGPIALIKEKVALGRLVVVLDLEGARALYFTLSCAQGWSRQPKIVAFREWLHAELGSSSGLDLASGEVTIANQ